MGKFWNGDVQLVKAYWIYGLLLPNGVFLLLWLSGLELVPGSATAILFATTTLAYLVFWGVGTWRSATKYTGPKVWAILTKIHLALPLVGLALAIAIPAFETPKDRTAQPSRAEVLMAPANVAKESPIPKISAPDDQLREHSQTSSPVATQEAAKTAIQVPENKQTETMPLAHTAQIDGHLSGLTLQYFRQQIPQLNGLSDADALDILHKNYYPTVDKQRMAEVLGVESPVAKPKLGWLDQSRYESCQQDAAKAPTPHGVNVGLRICREKFNQ